MAVKLKYDMGGGKAAVKPAQVVTNNNTNYARAVQNQQQQEIAKAVANQQAQAAQRKVQDSALTTGLGAGALVATAMAKAGSTGGGGNAGGGGGSTPSYSQNMQAYNGAFQPSAAYQQALAYTQEMLEKLTSGRTSYTDKLNESLKRIEDFRKFSYDMTQDSLFQNALSGAMSSGQIAMQDTIGQASALTGGYGSTYATGAANQAYNSMIQGAFDKLPEFYKMARDAYNEDFNREVNKFGMYQDLDQQEYGRLLNAYNAHYQNTNDMYNREYTDFWNNKNFENQNAQFAEEMAYKRGQAAQSQANWEAQWAYQMEQDAKNEQAAKDKAAQAQSNWEKELQLEYDKLNASNKKNSQPSAPTAKQYETALALYNKGGDGEGSDYRNYINSLPENVDIGELDSYVTAKGDPRVFKSVDIGNFWTFSKADNTFEDQWGTKYTAQQLMDEFNLTKEEIRKIKSK